MPAADLRTAHRYAGALFRVARDRNELEATAQSLDEITTVIEQSPELLAVLHHPRVTRERKQEVLRHIFENRVPLLVEQFLFLLIEKDRATVLSNAAKVFHNLWDEYRHQADAEAISAVALTPEQQAALKQQLETATGYTMRLTTRVDESIIGGLIVRIGDHLLDGSVATQLQTMRDQLKRARA